MLFRERLREVVVWSMVTIALWGCHLHPCLQHSLHILCIFHGCCLPLYKAICVVLSWVQWETIISSFFTSFSTLLLLLRYAVAIVSNLLLILFQHLSVSISVTFFRKWCVRISQGQHFSDAISIDEWWDRSSDIIVLKATPVILWWLNHSLLTFFPPAIYSFLCCLFSFVLGWDFSLSWSFQKSNSTCCLT